MWLKDTRRKGKGGKWENRKLRNKDEMRIRKRTEKRKKIEVR
jgi:hypothetical protein